MSWTTITLAADILHPFQNSSVVWEYISSCFAVISVWNIPCCREQEYAAHKLTDRFCVSYGCSACMLMMMWMAARLCISCSWNSMHIEIIACINISCRFHTASLANLFLLLKPNTFWPIIWRHALLQVLKKTKNPTNKPTSIRDFFFPVACFPSSWGVICVIWEFGASYFEWIKEESTDCPVFQRRILHCPSAAFCFILEDGCFQEYKINKFSSSLAVTVNKYSRVIDQHFRMKKYTSPLEFMKLRMSCDFSVMGGTENYQGLLSYWVWQCMRKHHNIQFMWAAFLFLKCAEKGSGPVFKVFNNQSQLFWLTKRKSHDYFSLLLAEQMFINTY